jgi:hypothetical protein
MWDLGIAAVVLIVLSSATLLAGFRTARRRSERGTFFLGVVVLTALLVFTFRFHGTWQIARLIPYSGAIILGNWIPLGGAFLAGITLGQNKSTRWRRCFLAGLILFVSGYSVVCCFQGHLPTGLSDGRRARLSEQGRRSSCGACCAATLLRRHGFEVTEVDMLRPCLTSHRGCPALGLYRGLKLKTAGTAWDVEVVTCTLEELIETPGPRLLRISLPATEVLSNKGQFHRKKERSEHAVLLMEVDSDGQAKVFDPSYPGGYAPLWDVDRLREQWLGEALRLVPRD